MIRVLLIVHEHCRAGNPQNLPTPIKVATCDLQVAWRDTVIGTLSPGLHPFGIIVGLTQQTMTLHYDARS